jgi:serine/threonine protein phosphatase PrpC
LAAFEPVRYAALTDVGVKRSHNQDACLPVPAADEAAWRDHGHVFVVADGMGGHAVGEKASFKAVRDIPQIYNKHARDGAAAAIRRAFTEANHGIHSIGQENPEFRGLGTTAVALFLRPEGAWVGHVGDSRVYRFRDGKAEQLTFDHSWVWEIAKRQGVDPDELGDFKKNVIIRSLGPDPEVEVDVEGPHPVQPGDVFLLCSDGLTGVVMPDEVGAVATTLPPEEAAKLLVHLANLRGGPDNITVMIVRVGGGSEAGDGRPGTGFFTRLLRGWNRRVPLPFTALGGGGLLAGLALAMHLGEVPGASALFVLAAAVILGGIGGLVAQLMKDQPEEEPARPEDEGPRELHVYKTTPCAVTADVADKFAQLETALVQAMKAQDVAADWGGHDKLTKAAEAAKPKGDGEAFKARCKALLFLAEAFHKARNKEESFRPSWKDRNGPGHAGPTT